MTTKYDENLHLRRKHASSDNFVCRNDEHIDQLRLSSSSAAVGRGNCMRLIPFALCQFTMTTITTRTHTYIKKCIYFLFFRRLTIELGICY